MVCSDDSPEEEYKFFEYIYDYINYEALLEQKEISNSFNLNYSFIESLNSEKVQELTAIANKLIYLNDLLFNTSDRKVSNDDYNHDYLNFWLNQQINEIDSDSFCKKSFYQYFKSHNRTNVNLLKLNSKIHDIEENELKAMNALYNLYKNFSKLNEKIKEINPKEEECIRYAKQCVEEYEKLKDKCNGVRTKFCNILTKFKNKYEEISLCQYNFINWRKEKLPSLTNDSDELLLDCKPTGNSVDTETIQEHIGPVPNEDNSDIYVHNITAGTVGTLGISFICFILYRFTSFGPWLHSRISKNENIIENLNEEMNHFSHTSEFEQRNSDITYNIAYNSV
ncbi:PIR Superfamily Protein [Plasmodium ovale curtisi]|uniref:PIR Superfamily Protein n=1 Tax=Plasmodium ovale curtisi TaxID=864141 RepID=A0A1A8WH30_PLAOA|nr:PIR Superfamily Protein [Plasmodium ovale curtisi]